jgi:glycosyltransferase involved in cell wall biosynthesis
MMDHWIRPYDVLFSVSVFPTGLWAVRVGRWIRRKVVVQAIALEFVSLPDIQAGNLFRPWLRKITEWVYKHADVVIMVAEYQKKLALSCLDARDIVVLPLRIDTRHFPYRNRTVAFPVQFIHIAYYSPIKGQDTLFRAFARVSEHIDCHLTVIGQGFEQPEVRALLGQLDIQDRVSFTGTVLQSDLPGYFEQAHILLHTSRFETGCAVIQEAMASGVAVCGTAVGILADIGDRYAVIVPPGDDIQLAEKVRALVGSPEAYQRITTEAYQWISQYDAVWAANNYRLFLEAFLSKR